MDAEYARELSGQGDSEGQPVAGEHDPQCASSPAGSTPASPVASRSSTPTQLAHPVVLVSEPELDRREKKRLARRDRKKRKRDADRKQQDASEYYHRASQSEKYPSLKRVRVNTFNAESLPSTSNVFTGQIQDSGLRVPTRTELLEQGYTELPWDGRKPKGLEDAQGRLFMVLAGRPVGDDSWVDVEQGVDDAFVQAEAEVRRRTCRSCKDLPWEKRCPKCFERRGDFKCKDVGVSFGNGRLEPGNLVISPRDARITTRIILNSNFQRLLGFINGAFAWFAPKLWLHYSVTLDKLFLHHPHLIRLFPRSVFPTAAFNFGPQVTTVEHTDCTNLPFGWCAVYASGQFDSKLGGHLVLRDLKLLIEFPAGSVIFLPSATLMHGNTAIGEHETRRSFTQFAPGGLFRWVYYGFRKEGDMKTADAERFKHSFNSAPARKAEALSMFSTASSLHKDRLKLAK